MTTLRTKAQLIRDFLLPESAAVNIEASGALETPEAINTAVANWVRRLRLVQIAGARHGKAGYYPDSEFGSDADWCNGVGYEINALETELDIDDGSVFELYSEAHSAFYRDGTINPGDRDSYSNNSVFTFYFGAQSDTVVSVWAQADHLEDALEMAAEHLAKVAPDVFADEPDHNQAAIELGIDLSQYTADMYDMPDDVMDRIRETAEVDMTYTESGWLLSWEWSVGESDTPPGPDASARGRRRQSRQN